MPREIEIREPSGPVMFNTMADVARAIGVNHQTITTHQHKEGFPQKTRAGKWNARKIYQYFVDYNSKMLAKPAKKAAKDKEEEQTRLIASKANMSEMEEARLRGELFTRDSVQNAFFEIGQNMASKMNVLPNSLAMKCVGKQLGEVEKEIRTALTLLAAEFSRECGEGVKLVNKVEDN